MASHPCFLEDGRRPCAGAVTQASWVPAASLAFRSTMVPGHPAGAGGGRGCFHRRRSPSRWARWGGSNGKTTTKEMVGAILAVRGPALKTQGTSTNEVGIILRLRPEHVAAVVELGMGPHPGETASCLAVMRTCAHHHRPARHLEGLRSIEGVARRRGRALLASRRGPSRWWNLFLTRCPAGKQGLVGFGRAAGAEIAICAEERARLVIETVGGGGRSRSGSLGAQTLNAKLCLRDGARLPAEERVEGWRRRCARAAERRRRAAAGGGRCLHASSTVAALGIWHACLPAGSWWR